MNNLYKWCVYKMAGRRHKSPVIWLMLIMILLIIDIGVSQDGSVIGACSRELEAQQTVSDNGFIHSSNYVRCAGIPAAKAPNAQIVQIFNILNNNDNMPYKVSHGNDFVFHINYIKDSMVAVVFTIIVILICAIIFFLEKILSFIQNNDGKKGVSANYC